MELAALLFLSRGGTGFPYRIVCCATEVVNRSTLLRRTTTFARLLLEMVSIQGKIRTPEVSYFNIRCNIDFECGPTNDIGPVLLVGTKPARKTHSRKVCLYHLDKYL